MGTETEWSECEVSPLFRHVYSRFDQYAVGLIELTCNVCQQAKDPHSELGISR